MFTFLQACTAPRQWFGLERGAERATTRSTAMSLYVGGVIVSGAVLLFQFAPRTYPSPLLELSLLVSGCILSVFKLRLPLGRGNSTMSMAYAVTFTALIIEGAGM